MPLYTISVEFMYGSIPKMICMQIFNTVVH